MSRKTRAENYRHPFWERPTHYAEVRALFREGRLSLGPRPVRDGLNAARAVIALGVPRGIASFERYGFVKRQGLAYLAVPLGRRRVEPNPQGDLLNDLAPNNWLERLRNTATSDEASAELRAAGSDPPAADSAQRDALGRARRRHDRRLTEPECRGLASRLLSLARL